MEFLPGMHGSIVHHPSIVSLLQSAATCPLCKLFVSWIDEKRMNVNVADAKERRWTRSILRGKKVGEDFDHPSMVSPISLFGVRNSFFPRLEQNQFQA